MTDPSYSAFGSIAPVHDPIGERIRWFCPWLISGPVALRNALNRLDDVKDCANASRITFRVVSEGGLSPECVQTLTQWGLRIEALLPVGGADGRVMTYIGKCSDSRKSGPSDTRREKLILDGIMAMPRKGPRLILANFRKLGGFHVELVQAGGLAPADLDRLVWLHRETFPTFPYDFEKKLDLMLTSPSSYVMAVVRSRRNQRIYSFSNLELTDVTFDDGSVLRLAEYDNTMRVSHCPELGEIHGLGAILRVVLASQAARHGVDLCHAESRTGLAAINAISYHSGMRLGGTLESHLLISGENDIRYDAPSRFQSMNVWHLNRDALAVLPG
jgi:hypothetical protein